MCRLEKDDGEVSKESGGTINTGNNETKALAKTGELSHIQPSPC
jgi:hypothetical protein